MPYKAKHIEGDGRSNNKGQWGKGQSGNPSGKKAMSAEDRQFFSEEFHRLSRKTVERFSEILHDPKADRDHIIRVGSEVFNRFFGKQSKGFSGEGDEPSGIVVVFGEDFRDV